ncbi:PhoH family protein [Corynebacterium sp. 320]|uniref:PhoH-like protein n=1 Tax=Corynebacterium zhongnanshanii TaxID=2768834 RepID=A0ABQ6VGZ8_9CORY|nr:MULTISPECIES: PhoH family protein [Corynebacterium]KAB1502415.1 PhoH family protein [Corynebacterium sp. 320]KAB1551364.1 PhoH family protein [Corynebacterium sp. 321]KAB1551807.1 PhoH family protein [Corynebacterium sp. 319]KAB3520904.1 PhoH family protein [Corynebacterium zhongnanshanii]KAB3526022.1 PhoH family protein [Corynebacterium sp. 250]
MRPSSNAHPRVASSTIEIDPAIIVSVLGRNDENLRVVENSTDADLLARGNCITIRGEAREVSHARRALEEMVSLVERGNTVDADATRRIMRSVEDAERPGAMTTEAPETIVTYRGKSVRPKTMGQQQYITAIDECTVVFGVGPAGTGKTYLAMAKAVQALMRKDVSRIILTRPAVEAGEKLGFLPGTLNDKIDPYLRPLHDALREMVDPETIPRMMEAGIIEVAPLAYMRGRTLNDSFVILDEAQNTTPAQMKMFLTRLGFNTKMVITGDMTQVDLPHRQESGLKVAQSILRSVPGVYVSQFDSDDVVRHRLVSRIVEAYDSYEAEQWQDDEDVR